MNRTGYILKAKEGTMFAGNYMGQNSSFVIAKRSAIIYNDEMHAKSELDKIAEHPRYPYIGFKKEDVELVEVKVIECSEVPDLSWMWHGSDSVMGYKSLMADNSVAESWNNAATTGMRLTLRRLEDLGIIQMSDIDRSPNEEDKKKWEKSL